MSCWRRLSSNDVIPSNRYHVRAPRKTSRSSKITTLTMGEKDVPFMESRTGCPPRGTSSSLIEAESTPMTRTERDLGLPGERADALQEEPRHDHEGGEEHDTGSPAAFLNRRARNATAAAMPRRPAQAGGRGYGTGPGTKTASSPKTTAAESHTQAKIHFRVAARSGSFLCRVRRVAVLSAAPTKIPPMITAGSGLLAAARRCRQTVSWWPPRAPRQ